MEVTARYVSSNAEQTRRLTPKDVPVTTTLGGVQLRTHENRFGSLEATITSVRVLDGWGQACSAVSSGSSVVVEMELDSPPSIHDCNAGVTLRRADDAVCLDAATVIAGGPVPQILRLEIERLDLAAGKYAFDVGLYSLDWSRTFDYHYGAYPLAVVGRAPGAGVLAPPMQWVKREAPRESSLGEGGVIRWRRP